MADEEKRDPVMVTEDLGAEHPEPVDGAEKLDSSAPSPEKEAADLTAGPAAPPDNTAAPPAGAATASPAAPDGDAASAQKSAEASTLQAPQGAAGEPAVSDLSKEPPPDATDDLPVEIEEAFVEPPPPPRHWVRVPRALLATAFFTPPGSTVVATMVEADYLVVMVEGSSRDKRCIVEDVQDEHYGPMRRIRWE